MHSDPRLRYDFVFNKQSEFIRRGVQSGIFSPNSGHGENYRHWRQVQRAQEVRKQRARWHGAFEKTLRVYSELRSLPGVGSSQADPLGYRQGLTYLKLDFLCEVDLIVKSILSSEEQRVFRQLAALYSLTGIEAERNRAATKLGIDIVTRSRIGERIGKVLVQRGVHPPALYFKHTKTGLPGWRR